MKQNVVTAARDFDTRQGWDPKEYFVYFKDSKTKS